MVGAAASTWPADLRVPRPDFAVLDAKLDRVAVIEFGSVVERLMASSPRSGARRSCGRCIDFHDGFT
jgi:hypothetical protein